MKKQSKAMKIPLRRPDPFAIFTFTVMFSKEYAIYALGFSWMVENW